MIKTLYASLFAILLVSPLCSPAQAKKTLNDLGIRWEILENNYQGSTQTRSVLTLSTNNKFTLPAKGWKLYFNFARPIRKQLVSGGVKITHVNGDFFYMEPRPDFKGINAGASLRTEFVSGDWVVNKTDAPAGFYLIWDNAPDQYYTLPDVVAVPSTKSTQIMRTALDKIPFQTPEITYAQNAGITSQHPAIKIFPTPVRYHENAQIFALSAQVKVTANPSFVQEAALLKQFLSDILVKAQSDNLRAGNIQLVLKDLPENAYELSVTNQSITIAAATSTGIFYGIQSLKSLISPDAYAQKQRVVTVPGVEVFDQPRFGYRAFMMDVARNFQTKKEVLKLLDLMAFYKLNTLHFHLNDDEGWRLEIPALPELAQVSGKRGHTLTEKDNLQPTLGSGPYTDNPNASGYYTKADYIEILKYAAARHIQVIPEIESPGHARAAIKAMASRNDPKYLLHEPGDSSVYRSVQYWNDNVMNVALPSVYNFIETLTAEIKAMYDEAGVPLKTIHYGGDEVPAGVWEKSPAVQQLMSKHPEIKSPDDLWVYYYNRVNDILKAQGLYMTAWEEVGTRKVLKDGKKETVFNEDLLGKNLHLDVWNNMMGWGAEDLAYTLANKGYQVILSCVTNMYFDMAYQKDFDEPGYYWGGYVDLDKIFGFIPYDYFKNTKTDRMGNPLSADFLAGKQRLNAEGKQNIVGLQAALWSETAKGPALFEYLILPKLMGLAERSWAKDPDWAMENNPAKFKSEYGKAWSGFLNVIGKRELPRLNYYAGGFNYRIPTPGAIVKNGSVLANLQIPGFSIRYTTDGSIPSKNSKLYTGPIKARGTIKLAAFNAVGRSGKVAVIKNFF